MRWEGHGVKPHRWYLLLEDDGSKAGVTVRHCGHPTALYPYYIEVAWLDEIQLAPTGRGFPLLADAKARALELHEERPGV